jgi:hypothetical protein
MKPVPLLHIALHAAATRHVPWQLIGHGVVLVQLIMRTVLFEKSQIIPLY